MEFDVSQLSNHICINESLKNDAYSVRYHSYVSVKFITENDSGLFIDQFDHLANNFTFLLKKEQKPVATLRASVYRKQLNWLGMPCLSEGFDNEINELADKFDYIIEVNRLAVLPGQGDFNAVAPLALFTNMILMQRAFPNAAMVCAASSSHKRFYQRLGMKQLCDVAPRPNAEIPLTLMMVDLTDCEFLAGNYLTPEEANKLAAHVSDEQFTALFRPNAVCELETA